MLGGKVIDEDSMVGEIEFSPLPIGVDSMVGGFVKDDGVVGDGVAVPAFVSYLPYKTNFHCLKISTKSSGSVMPPPHEQHASRAVMLLLIVSNK